MKHLSLILSVLLISFPAFAQEEATPVPESGNVAVSSELLDLAKQMHEIWPIRTRIESAIESVSESFPAEQRAEIKAAMRKAIQFDQVEEASIQAMAETFTADELKAMIEFYGSETGRSISAKTGDYEEALRPVLMQMMDKAMLELRTGQAR